MRHIEPAGEGIEHCAAEAWVDGHLTRRDDSIASEVPVALAYNGISHAVMLAGPCDLEDFGIGFSLSEGIVEDRREIVDCEVAAVDSGICVNLTVSAMRFAALKERRRNLAGRTGCGLCGAESLDQVFRPLPRVASPLRFDAAALHRAFAALAVRQPLYARTGAVHAAGWSDAQGRLALVREDVGRHNALDKLIGAMAAARMRFDDGFVVLTSRASSEMVQKAATLGIAALAAISAPTTLAIRIAEECGVTLAGFVRERRHAVYANPGRLVESAEIVA